MKKYSHYYSSEGYSITAPVVEVRIKRPGGTTFESEPFIALVDTGADGTLLPKDILASVNPERYHPRRMTGVTGKSILVQTFIVNVIIGDIEISGIRAVAMPVGSEPIIGRDVLNQLIVTLNGLAGVVEISD